MLRRFLPLFVLGSLPLFAEGDFFDPPSETGHIEVIGDYSLGCQMVLADYHLYSRKESLNGAVLTFRHMDDHDRVFQLYVELLYDDETTLEEYVEWDLTAEGFENLEHEESEPFLGGRYQTVAMKRVRSESWNEVIQQLYFIKKKNAFSFYTRANKREPELIEHFEMLLDQIADHIELF